MNLAVFLANVNVTDGCWLWLRSKNHWGYGRVKFKGKMRQAHRVSWELAKGPIPQGLQIDHLCRVRACVRPEHLEPVTPKENTLRSSGFASVNAKKTHCKRGHPFSPENTYKQHGGRGCKRCSAIHSLRWYHQHKEL